MKKSEFPKMTANLKTNETYSAIRNIVIELEDFTITVKPKQNFEYVAEIIEIINNIDYSEAYFRSKLKFKFKK